METTKLKNTSPFFKGNLFKGESTKNDDNVFRNFIVTTLVAMTSINNNFSNTCLSTSILNNSESNEKLTSIKESDYFQKKKLKEQFLKELNKYSQILNEKTDVLKNEIDIISPRIIELDFIKSNISFTNYPSICYKLTLKNNFSVTLDYYIESNNDKHLVYSLYNNGELIVFDSGSLENCITKIKNHLIIDSNFMIFEKTNNIITI